MRTLSLYHSCIPYSFIVRYGLSQKHTSLPTSRMAHLPSSVARLKIFTHLNMDEEKNEIIMVFVERQICELLYCIKQ